MSKDIVNMEDVEFPEDDEEINGVDLSYENEIVCEVSMTRRQVKSLKWVLKCWLKQYLPDEGSPTKTDIQELADALEEV